MSIELTCSGCSRRLQVADEHLGKQARCPECGALTTVPAMPAAESALPDSTRDQGQERWYLSTPQGPTYGPVTRSELDQWFREGRIQSSATLRSENSQAEVPATTLFPQLAVSSSNPFADLPDNPYTPASYSGYNGRRHRGGLILGLGISSLITSLFLCCPFLQLPSLGLGIAAVSFGLADLRSIRAGEMDPSGHGSAVAGIICGGIAIAFSILGLVLIVMGMVSG
ncbi:MAG: hypothetical protein RIS70_2608 [Planctomycetota bacterium]